MKAISLLVFLAACATPEEKVDLTKAPLHPLKEKFSQCYVESDSYLGKNKQAPGGMTVQFTVNREGRVKDSRIVESAYKDPNLHACILGLIKTTEFEPLQTETMYSQPISFHNRNL